MGADLRDGPVAPAEVCQREPERPLEELVALGVRRRRTQAAFSSAMGVISATASSSSATGLASRVTPIAS
jgi:hypothetical protein